MISIYDWVRGKNLDTISQSFGIDLCQKNVSMRSIILSQNESMQIIPANKEMRIPLIQGCSSKKPLMSGNFPGLLIEIGEFLYLLLFPTLIATEFNLDISFSYSRSCSSYNLPELVMITWYGILSAHCILV